MLTVTLAPGRDKRLHAGHPWIYRSEIAKIEGETAPGVVAAVHDHRGRFLAQVTLNPKSQIAGRVISHIEEAIDGAFIERRIRTALSKNGRTASGPGASRLVFGEGDGLPGLIVDRYADFLVIQILTAGMERLREAIIDALRRVVGPRAIYERSDSSARTLEGLEPRKGFVWGTGDTGIWIREGDLAFFVEAALGQKTGFFLDQRENRQVVKALAHGRNVLDCFCYSGGFSVSAGAGGAASVVGIDISSEALSWAERSAERNGLSACCRFMPANAFDQLRAFAREGRAFELVILDPPAFTKGRDALAGALRGYNEINLRAMKILSPGGILVTCSCSYHVDAPTFLDMLRSAATDARREFHLRELRTQAADHPILLAARETQYLKCAILEALN